MSVISINSTAADATLRFSDAAPAAASLASNDTLEKKTDAPANGSGVAAAEMGAEFVLRGVSFGGASPTSLADLLALSPFAAASPASSPADSLDSDREYYVALREARKQLAAKLRGALRDLHEERAVKKGLLRKRYQMRNRCHAAGVGGKPQAAHARAQQSQPQQRAPCALEVVGADSFSAPAPPAAAAASKPRPPPKISATDVAARIGASGGSASRSVAGGKVAVPQERWYGDDVRMCSSPVSEEFEVEVELVENDGDAHHGDVVAAAGVSMVPPECRV